MKGFKRFRGSCRTGCVAALAAFALASAQPPTFPLQVVIIDEQGQPLDGVDGVARGAEFQQTRSGGLDGQILFNLPAGQYDLSFSRPNFYETLIRDVRVEIVEDPKLRKEQVGPLRILMQRRLSFEKDLIVIGPKYVDAPSLEVGFEPSPPAVQLRPARGIVTLTNRGSEPIEIPQSRDYEWTPELRIMYIFIELRDRDAYYDQPFACIPGQDCHSLQPGESIEISVQLILRTGYSAGQRIPTNWEEGESSGRVGVYFVLPGLSPHELYTSHKVHTYTRTVETPFTITVRSEPE